MADVKIKVGASIDSSLENAMKPLVDAARKSRQQINADQKSSDKQAANASIALWRDQYKENSRLNREMFKAQVSGQKDAQKQATDVAKEQIRARTRMAIEAAKEAAKAERDEAKRTASEKSALAKRVADDMRRAESGGGGGRGGGGRGGLIGYLGGRHIANSFGRSVSSLARGAGGVAGGIAHGLGVDFDLSSIVRRNSERQQMAADITNSSYQPGAAGAAGQRQDPNALRSEANNVANKFGYDPTKLLGGLKEFVSLTGDLETGRKVLGDIGMVARATGSDVEAVAEAAGNVSAKLPDTADKGAKVVAVLRAMAGQGKLGAAELRQMAPQMASLAAAAQQFGGDTSGNIAMMGVLLQEARQKGGAKSTAQAGTSVMSFVNTFSKGARVNAFKAAGINPYDKTGAIKDPETLIMESLKATKGSNLGMGKLFADIRARTAVRGFENTFRSAAGGTGAGLSQKQVETGLAAVHAEIKRLKDIAMGAGEAAEEAKKASETDQAKAQRFQNQLDKVGEGVQARLMPALEKLAPSALQVAEGLGKMIEWASGNPMEAVTIALVGSVAKAGIGEAVARTLGLGMAGQAAGVAGLGAFAATIGVATLAIGALGLAADQAYKLWKELHPEISFAPGTTDEEKKRLSGLTPDQKRAEIAAGRNAAALDASGHTTGMGKTFGPPTAAVQAMTDSKMLLTSSELQAKFLGDILQAQLTSIDELRRLGGENPNGSNGFSPPPLPGGGVTPIGTPGGGAEIL